FLAEVPDPRDPEVGYWPLARLPLRVVAATLAVEDRRFRRHPGVDPLAVVRGVAQNLRAGRRASGASTIAMQVARLEGPGPRAGAGAAARPRRSGLRTVRAAQVLGRDDYDLAVRQIAALRIPPLGRRPPEALHAVRHLERLFRHGAPPPAPLVNTTLDLDVQQAVAAMVADALGELEERGAGNAAVIVVERGTNRVVAWVGSAGYFDARHAGAYDYARVPRSPGSTLKPFLYALALERGAITPATILDDILRTPGDITNADEAFLGPLLPRV